MYMKHMKIENAVVWMYLNRWSGLCKQAQQQHRTKLQFIRYGSMFSGSHRTGHCTKCAEMFDEL